MRIVVLAAGSFAMDERLPHRMIADVTEDGTRHTVELDRDYWSCTCEDGDCEHIAAVMPLAGQEQAAPVADGPVTLDLDEVQLIADCADEPGEQICGWTIVSATRTGTGRRVVVRDGDGRHFAAHLRHDLTEMPRPEPREGEKTVTFEPVMPRAKVVRTVEWVKPDAGGEGAAR